MSWPPGDYSFFDSHRFGLMRQAQIGFYISLRQNRAARHQNCDPGDQVVLFVEWIDYLSTT